MEMATPFSGDLTEMTQTLQLNSTQQLGGAETHGSHCVEVSAAALSICGDTMVTAASRLWVERVVYIGVIPLLAAVGVTVNVLNMAVFVKQGLGDRVHLSLFSLSLVDLLVLTSMCIRHLNKLMGLFMSHFWVTEIWSVHIVRYRLASIPVGFQLVSMFISIVIAVDRCVCVTWPLHAAHMLSTRVTGLVILVSSVLIFSGKQFTSFRFDIICAFVAGRERSPVHILLPSALYKDIPVVMEVLDTLVLSFLTPTLAFLIIASATTIVAFKLKKASAWRARTAGRTGTDVISQKEKSLTSMLVVISCTYLACTSPRVLYPMLRFIVPGLTGWSRLCNVNGVINCVANVTVAVNSTVNFFVYYKMGSNFRQTLQGLLSCSVRRSSKK